ncbi:MAG TPA: helix-turn-helix domain-containing protein [Salinarimonas sp.]|nr:helix-turn-helix domain-containing protein [Salinarimonas sp.]
MMSPDRLDPGPASAGPLRAHPAFRSAMLRSAAGLTGLYQGNRLLNRLLNDRGRAVMGFLALYLDALGRAEPRHPGLTTNGIKALFARMRLCSPGRAAAMLAVMRVAGYVAVLPTPVGADRRLRRLQPTERLVAIHLARWRVQFEAIGLVVPALARIAPRLDERPFRDRFVIDLVGRRLAGSAIIEAAPGLELFAERDAGVMILFSLIMADAGGDAAPVSVSALSRRFGVSRAHVGKLLQDAAAAGLLERREEGAVRLLPALVDATEEFFATAFATLIQAAEAALDGERLAVAS